MNFKKAVVIILKHEGGYVNHPSDPGGETNFGISKRAYPHLEISKLTEIDARQIYRRDYWDAVKADLLPSNLRLMVFDAAVNHGPGLAIRILQRLVKVGVDGVIGPATLEGLNHVNIETLPVRYAKARLDIYMQNKNFNKFGTGWLRRLLSITYDTALDVTRKEGAGVNG